MNNYVVSRYGLNIDLSKEGKTQCPRCRHNGKDRSHNNLMVYGLDENGKHRGSFCFSCEMTIPSQQWLEENGETIEEEYEDIVGTEFNEEVHNKLKEITSVDPKGFRGLKRETCAFFGVRHEYSTANGELVAQYYPVTKDGTLVGYKKRAIPKQFTAIGDCSKSSDMFGYFRFAKSSGKYCVIAAGEMDQLSAFQILKDYNDSRGGDYEPIPVVSSTVGESAGFKQVQNHYEWFSRFERIIVIPDQDAAGKEALDKLAKVLPKGKVFVMTLPMKDSNEMLMAGKNKEFINAFFRASSYTPDGIVGSGDLMEKIKQAAVVPKIPLPPFMHKLQGLMAGGIPLGTILVMGSMSGAGKSTISEEMVYFWAFNSPHKIGIVSLESDCAQYGTKLLSRHISKKIDLIDDPLYKVNFLNSEEVDTKALELFKNSDGTHRFHLIDERDGGLDSLKEQIMQLIVACDCRVIILDPLTDILDGMSNEEQSVFMKWLKGMVKSHQVSFILISHVRKSSSGAKANSTGADLHEEDFMGSSSIFKSSACNLLFTRNKEHEDETLRNVTTMKMTKCRWTGRTSPVAGQFFYCNETHTLYDYDDWLIKNPQEF